MTVMRLSMKVWDAPIRLFHWIIVLLVCTSWYFAETDQLPLHFLSGYCILTLLLFRLVWGVVGSDTARFAQFMRSPALALRHLAHLRRREPDDEVGHNPAGGWMVAAILTVLAVQVGTGRCSNADFDKAPFADAVGKSLSDTLSTVHSYCFTLLQILVVVHVAAVLTYALVKKQDLVRPMITGKKRLPVSLRAPRIRSPLLALPILLVAALLVWGLVSLGGS